MGKKKKGKKGPNNKHNKKNSMPQADAEASGDSQAGPEQKPVSLNQPAPKKINLKQSIAQLTYMATSKPALKRADQAYVEDLIKLCPECELPGLFKLASEHGHDDMLKLLLLFGHNIPFETFDILTLIHLRKQALHDPAQLQGDPLNIWMNLSVKIEALTSETILEALLSDNRNALILAIEANCECSILALCDVAHKHKCLQNLIPTKYAADMFAQMNNPILTKAVAQGMLSVSGGMPITTFPLTSDNAYHSLFALQSIVTLEDSAKVAAQFEALWHPKNAYSDMVLFDLYICACKHNFSEALTLEIRQRLSDKPIKELIFKNYCSDMILEFLKAEVPRFKQGSLLDGLTEDEFFAVITMVLDVPLVTLVLQTKHFSAAKLLKAYLTGLRDTFVKQKEGAFLIAYQYEAVLTELFRNIAGEAELLSELSPIELTDFLIFFTNMDVVNVCIKLFNMTKAIHCAAFKDGFSSESVIAKMQYANGKTLMQFTSQVNAINLRVALYDHFPDEVQHDEVESLLGSLVSLKRYDLLLKLLKQNPNLFVQFPAVQAILENIFETDVALITPDQQAIVEHILSKGYGQMCVAYDGDSPIVSPVALQYISGRYSLLRRQHEAEALKSVYEVGAKRAIAAAVSAGIEVPQEKFKPGLEMMLSKVTKEDQITLFDIVKTIYHSSDAKKVTLIAYFCHKLNQSKPDEIQNALSPYQIIENKDKDKICVNGLGLLCLIKRPDLVWSVLRRCPKFPMDNEPSLERFGKDAQRAEYSIMTPYFIACDLGLSAIIEMLIVKVCSQKKLGIHPSLYLQMGANESVPLYYLDRNRVATPDGAEFCQNEEMRNILLNDFKECDVKALTDKKLFQFFYLFSALKHIFGGNAVGHKASVLLTEIVLNHAALKLEITGRFKGNLFPQVCSQNDIQCLFAVIREFYEEKEAGKPVIKLTEDQKRQAFFVICSDPDADILPKLGLSKEMLQSLLAEEVQDYDNGYIVPVSRLQQCIQCFVMHSMSQNSVRTHAYLEFFIYLLKQKVSFSLAQIHCIMTQLHHYSLTSESCEAAKKMVGAFYDVLIGHPIIKDFNGLVYDERFNANIIAALSQADNQAAVRALKIQTKSYALIVNQVNWRSKNFAELMKVRVEGFDDAQKRHFMQYVSNRYQNEDHLACLDEANQAAFSIIYNGHYTNVVAAIALLISGEPLPDDLSIYNLCCLLDMTLITAQVRKYLSDRIVARIASHPDEINGDSQELPHPFVELLLQNQQALIELMLNHPGLKLRAYDPKTPQNAFDLVSLACQLGLPDVIVSKIMENLERHNPGKLGYDTRYLVKHGEPSAFVRARIQSQTLLEMMQAFVPKEDDLKNASNICLVELLGFVRRCLAVDIDDGSKEIYRKFEASLQQRILKRQQNSISVALSIHDPQLIFHLLKNSRDFYCSIKASHVEPLFVLAMSYLNANLLRTILTFVGAMKIPLDLHARYAWQNSCGESTPIELLREYSYGCEDHDIDELIKMILIFFNPKLVLSNAEQAQVIDMRNYLQNRNVSLKHFGVASLKLMYQESSTADLLEYVRASIVDNAIEKALFFIDTVFDLDKLKLIKFLEEFQGATLQLLTQASQEFYPKISDLALDINQRRILDSISLSSEITKKLKAHNKAFNQLVSNGDAYLSEIDDKNFIKLALDSLCNTINVLKARIKTLNAFDFHYEYLSETLVEVQQPQCKAHVEAVGDKLALAEAAYDQLKAQQDLQKEAQRQAEIQRELDEAARRKKAQEKAAKAKAKRDQVAHEQQERQRKLLEAEAAKKRRELRQKKEQAMIDDVSQNITLPLNTVENKLDGLRQQLLAASTEADCAAIMSELQKERQILQKINRSFEGHWDCCIKKQMTLNKKKHRVLSTKVSSLQNEFDSKVKKIERLAEQKRQEAGAATAERERQALEQKRLEEAAAAAAETERQALEQKRLEAEATAERERQALEQKRLEAKAAAEKQRQALEQKRLAEVAKQKRQPKEHRPSCSQAFFQEKAVVNAGEAEKAPVQVIVKPSNAHQGAFTLQFLNGHTLTPDSFAFKLPSGRLPKGRHTLAYNDAGLMIDGEIVLPQAKERGFGQFTLTHGDEELWDAFLGIQAFDATWQNGFKK